MTWGIRPDTRLVLLQTTRAPGLIVTLKDEGYEIRRRSNRRERFDYPHIFLPFLDAITMAVKISAIPAT